MLNLKKCIFVHYCVNKIIVCMYALKCATPAETNSITSVVFVQKVFAVLEGDHKLKQ